MQMTSIEGVQIRLRDYLPEDVESYRKWQRPGMKWQTLDGPYYQSDVDQSDKLAEDLKKRIQQADFPEPRMRLVVADKKTNELIGTVTSYWESKETHWLCIGITIYDPAHWGKGIGREAMGLWIDYLFEAYPKIVRLDMRTWSGNLGLIHLARKLGFSQEACFRKARIVDGHYFDGLGFGVLREEWKSIGSSRP